jgi:hypothetical protein
MCDIFVHANQYYKTLTCKVREFNYWRVDGMNFKCIFCAAVPQYALSDAGSARARMHPESMRKLRITMGAVLKIEVLHSAPSQDLSKATSPKTIELLCVAWPDSFGMLDEATLCMDASIVNDASLNLGVISTSCKVHDSLFDCYDKFRPAFFKSIALMADSIHHGFPSLCQSSVRVDAVLQPRESALARFEFV